MMRTSRLLSIATLCLSLAAGCGVRGLPGSAGEPGIQGPEGPIGAAGPVGADGADGQLRVYGDGSAGPLTISTNKVLGFDVATDGNYQFTDVTIDAGVTLRVASGTVLRCSGTFTNNGTVQVETGAGGGATNFNGGNMPQSGVRPAEGGISNAPAGSGSVSVNGDYAFGGLGGVGLNAFEAVVILNPGRLGGGGGGSTGTSFGSQAGRGGGTLVVLASGAITNAAGATIVADGASPAFGAGGGGGAGGVIVLASKTSAQQDGTLSTRGAQGGGQDQNVAAGGGGGGGIIHLLAPRFGAGIGPIQVYGGPGAMSVTTGPSNRYFGGGGGGACGGSGGIGAGFNPGGMNVPGGNGGPGHFFQTQTDPTAFF